MVREKRWSQAEHEWYYYDDEDDDKPKKRARTNILGYPKSAHMKRTKKSYFGLN